MMPPTLEDWRATLRPEFQADEGRFLEIAQDERRWDKAVFRELIEAMRDYCVHCANDEQLDRWMAHVFSMSLLLCVWTQQERFHRPNDEYWHHATHLLEVFSYFLEGEPPTQEGEVDVLTLE